MEAVSPAMNSVTRELMRPSEPRQAQAAAPEQAARAQEPPARDASASQVAQPSAVVTLSAAARGEGVAQPPAQGGSVEARATCAATTPRNVRSRPTRRCRRWAPTMLPRARASLSNRRRRASASRACCVPESPQRCSSPLPSCPYKVSDPPPPRPPGSARSSRASRHGEVPNSSRPRRPRSPRRLRARVTRRTLPNVAPTNFRPRRGRHAPARKSASKR